MMKKKSKSLLPVKEVWAQALTNEVEVCRSNQHLLLCGISMFRMKW